MRMRSLTTWLLSTTFSTRITISLSRPCFRYTKQKKKKKRIQKKNNQKKFISRKLTKYGNNSRKSEKLNEYEVFRYKSKFFSKTY